MSDESVPQSTIELDLGLFGKYAFGSHQALLEWLEAERSQFAFAGSHDTNVHNERDGAFRFAIKRLRGGPELLGRSDFVAELQQRKQRMLTSASKQGKFIVELKETRGEKIATGAMAIFMGVAMQHPGNHESNEGMLRAIAFDAGCGTQAATKTAIDALADDFRKWFTEQTGVLNTTLSSAEETRKSLEDSRTQRLKQDEADREALRADLEALRQDQIRELEITKKAVGDAVGKFEHDQSQLRTHPKTLS